MGHKLYVLYERIFTVSPFSKFVYVTKFPCTDRIIVNKIEHFWMMITLNYLLALSLSLSLPLSPLSLGLQ